MKLGAVKKNATGVILMVRIMDMTGAAKTGITYDKVKAAYAQNNAAAATPITLVAGTAGAFVAGGFVELDSTNLPGFYQFCPPDAAWADTTGAVRSVGMLIHGTSIADCLIEVALGVIDPPSYPSGILAATVGPGATTTAIPAVWQESGVSVAGITGRSLYFISGALYGQAQQISSESNSVLTTGAFSTAPQIGDQFIVA